MAELTVEQAISKFIELNQIDKKYGFKNAFRKIKTHINKTTAERFKKHVTPDGMPWKETAPKGAPIQIGDKYYFKGKGYDEAYPRIARKSNSREWKKINKYLKRRQKALFRNKAKNSRARNKLFKVMTKPSNRNYIFKYGTNYMVIGTNLPVARRMQNGSNTKNGKVPARPFYGLNKHDEKVIMNELTLELNKQIERVFK